MTKIKSINEYFAQSLDGDSFNSSNGVFKVTYHPFNDLSLAVGRDPDPSVEIKDSQYQVGDIVRGKGSRSKKKVEGEIVEVTKSQDGKFYRIKIQDHKTKRIIPLIPGSIEFIEDRGNSKNNMSVNVSAREKNAQNLKYSGGNVIWGSFESENDGEIPEENGKKIEGPMGTGITIVLKDSVNGSEHKLDGFLYDREKNTLECKRTNNYEDLKNSIKGAECYTFFNYHDDLQKEDDVLKCMICILFLEMKKELDAKKYLLRNFDKIAGTSYGEAKDEYLEKAKEMIKNFSDV